MKNVLITGSSRGIGAATARLFAEEGCNVYINYKNSKEKALELASSLGAYAIKADVANPYEVEEMFAALPPLDILCCNAGIAKVGLIQDMSYEEWREIFSVNTDGAFYCIKNALPKMITQKSGNIVIVSSILGLRGGSCEAAYSATKGALIALTKSLAKELGPAGIRVNSVAPGAIDTDMLACLDAAERTAVIDSCNVERLGVPEDVAKLIHFLASDNASYISGQIFGVDGGLII